MPKNADLYTQLDARDVLRLGKFPKTLRASAIQQNVATLRAFHLRDDQQRSLDLHRFGFAQFHRKLILRAQLASLARIADGTQQALRLSRETGRSRRVPSLA